MDRYIRLGLLTGVTKFSKVSVFSDLNNLEDISMSRDYYALCGITEEELHADFGEYARVLSAEQGIGEDKAYALLKEYYDGYHFAANVLGVYNPFSLLNAFKSREFGNYWFETGTPSYLVELLKRSHYDLRKLSQERTNKAVLDNIDAASNHPVPLLYQSGYLTIKGYEARFRNLHAGLPEQGSGGRTAEVPYTLLYADKRGGVPVPSGTFVKEVEAGDVDGFFRRLQSFLADTPYELAREQELHYQNVLFIVFKLVGLYVQAEYHTSQGRVDLLLQTPDYVYVMEFKLEGTAEEALRQIEEKGYARPFDSDTRRVFRIGVNFSRETRNIERWLVE